MPERLALLVALIALPAVADAECVRAFGLVCDAPYVVAEVTLVEAGRTWLTVTESVGDAPPVGERISLTTLDADRRHDQFVVSQGLRMGEIFDGAFNHFGARVTVAELPALRTDPAACEAELVQRGAEPPDCPGGPVGCASTSTGWLATLIFLLFGWQKSSRTGPDGSSGFRKTS